MQSLLERTKPLLAQAFKLYQSHWQPLSLTALLPMLPVAAIGLVIDRLIATAFLPGAILAMFLAFLVLLPASLMGGILAEGLLLIQADELSAGGEPLTVGQAFRRVQGRILPLLGTGFASSLLIVAGLVLFILPGLFFAYRLTAVAPVVVLEKKWGVAAMLRSSEIVRGAKNEFWMLFCALAGASFVVSNVISALLPSSLEVCASPLATAASLPLWTLGLALLYRDVAKRDRVAEGGAELIPESTIA